MNQFKKGYRDTRWFSYAEKVKDRDYNKCTKCGRKEPEVVLQCHHLIYKQNLKPWEYPLSDCITLCKGCHAREHNLIEPEHGWTLISIEDLGDLVGICERKGCGREIRYEHIAYHCNWGEKRLGSTCIEHLTMEDQFLSKAVLKILKKISDFVVNCDLQTGMTKKMKPYYRITHSHHQIRIYGKENYYSFQIALKLKGERWFDFKDFISAKGKTLQQVIELGYIVLKGITSEDLEEKNILRNIYVRIKD